MADRDVEDFKEPSVSREESPERSGTHSAEQVEHQPDPLIDIKELKEQMRRQGKIIDDMTKKKQREEEEKMKKAERRVLETLKCVFMKMFGPLSGLFWVAVTAVLEFGGMESENRKELEEKLEHFQEYRENGHEKLAKIKGGINNFSEKIEEAMMENDFKISRAQKKQMEMERITLACDVKTCELYIDEAKVIRESRRVELDANISQISDWMSWARFGAFAIAVLGVVLYAAVHVEAWELGEKLAPMTGATRVPYFALIGVLGAAYWYCRAKSVLSDYLKLLRDNERKDAELSNLKLLCQEKRHTVEEMFIEKMKILDSDEEIRPLDNYKSPFVC